MESKIGEGDSCLLLYRQISRLWKPVINEQFNDVMLL